MPAPSGNPAEAPKRQQLPRDEGASLTGGGRGSRGLIRAGWFAGGWIAVVIGGLGIIVPGLPTTVFFIVAAYCFGKSSPRFEQWVLDLPRIGPMVRDHRAGLGMPKRIKVVALAMMWTAIAISSVALREKWGIALGVVALGLVGTWYIVVNVPTKPLPEPEPGL